MESYKNKIIVVLGPTSSGKSGLAVEIAKKFRGLPVRCTQAGEIISADSRQVYRGLNIGSGKITKKEMCGIPHYMLDVISPRDQFSVAQYKRKADKIIADILRRNNIPIICGGTGQYIDALVYGITFPEVKPDKKLRARLKKKSTKELFKMLQKLDRRRAKNIDSKNPRRLIRAIEIAKKLGKVPSAKVRPSPKYDVLWIGLDMDNQELKKLIKKRLIARMKKGMVGEVRKLRLHGLSWKRMESLGLEYRALAQFLQKKITRQEMLAGLEKEIWHYVKRQRTWFKRNKNIRWFTPSEKAKILWEVKKFL